MTKISRAIEEELDQLSEEDARDGILFRFWIRMANEHPSETARAIATCTTPSAYRRALILLARKHGVNLP